MYVAFGLLALLVIWLGNKSRKNKDKKVQLGVLVANDVMDNVVTVMTLSSMFFILAEGMIAGGIHPPTEVYVDDNLRTFSHVIISLVGIIGMFGTGYFWRDFANPNKNKWITGVLVGICLALGILVPIGNLFIIGHGLGMPELLGNCISYSFSSWSSWDDYCDLMGYKLGYNPWRDMPYIMLPLVVTNCLEFLLIFIIMLVGFNDKYEKKKLAAANPAPAATPPPAAPTGGTTPPPSSTIVPIKDFPNHAHDDSSGENRFKRTVFMMNLDQKVLDILADNNHVDYNLHFNTTSEGVHKLLEAYTKVPAAYKAAWNQMFRSLATPALNKHTFTTQQKKEAWALLTNPIPNQNPTKSVHGAAIPEADLLALGLTNPA